MRRLCSSESAFIYRNTSHIQMNRKAEWHQPAVPRARVVVTREPEETGRAGQAGRGRGRAGQAGRQRQAAGEREENMTHVMRRSLVGHSQTNPDPSLSGRGGSSVRKRK